MGQYTCHIKPQPGEVIQTTVSLPREESALIAGTVLSPGGTPLADALVLLLRHQDGTLLCSTTTDDSGQFYLGPLAPDQLYTLRVQQEDRICRILELPLS